jgi:hypothetical protein
MKSLHEFAKIAHCFPIKGKKGQFVLFSNWMDEECVIGSRGVVAGELRFSREDFQCTTCLYEIDSTGAFKLKKLLNPLSDDPSTRNWT